MPYGDLAAQAVQRFAATRTWISTTAPSRSARSTSRTSNAAWSIYAGVDYEKILRKAEAEADVIIWDGGNNDLPFYQPDVHIVVVTPTGPAMSCAIIPARPTCAWPMP
jgi:predicted GTPase